MSRHERLAAANSNHQPKARNKHAPDPTWKLRQKFIRATRRGSKKHSTMAQKLELLDSATAAIPVTAKVASAIPKPDAVHRRLSQVYGKPFADSVAAASTKGIHKMNEKPDLKRLKPIDTPEKLKALIEDPRQATIDRVNEQEGAISGPEDTK